jgi:ATP-dependent DNA helicase RecQ
MTIHQILQKYWHFSTFRPLQEEIINFVLSGNDALALLPTGGGKSICFQVPALVNPGICIVITPLIALMNDQVQDLNSRGVKAISIFSGMSKREVDIALDNCIYGGVKFLYLSPERLRNELVQERIRYMNVNLFAIDEAHCISHWGYDFRPAYLQVKVLRSIHPKIPIIALTATAVGRVIVDIQEKLDFRPENSQVFKKSFFRENLSYMVLFEENKMGRLLKVIQRVKGSGIVYVRNRRESQEVSRYLMLNQITADYYHAGLKTPERAEKQLKWMKGITSVMVSTNAFGMGIDKPDVRFVIHLDLPDSLEAYFQEAGRAGRDGKKSFAVLLYHEADRIKLEKTFKMSFPTVEEIAQIYFHLGNYYQLAYGAGENLIVDFDIGDFCNRFQLNALKTVAALKFLEKDEWISISESVFLSSRIRFEINATELYRFQVEHASMDVLIKTILRTYGAAFDYYINIEEVDLARKLNVSMNHIISLLQKMEELNVISYLKRTDSPQIQFLRPRSDSNHLQIDYKYIAERKAIMRQQLDGIFNYLADDQCRSRKLLAYFGESDSSDCLICDYCIKVRKQENLQDEHLILIAEIHSLLLNGPLTIDELVNGLSVGDEKDRLDVIRKLIDSGEIKMNNGKYY